MSKARKPALRNCTYEVSPENHGNICEYLTSLSSGKDPWGWLQWAVGGFLVLVVFPGIGCRAVPPGLAQLSSAGPALPQALTALGFNSHLTFNFFWGLCPMGLSQTPLCCLLLLESGFLASTAKAFMLFSHHSHLFFTLICLSEQLFHVTTFLYHSPSSNNFHSISLSKQSKSKKFTTINFIICEASYFSPVVSITML